MLQLERQLLLLKPLKENNDIEYDKLSIYEGYRIG